MGQDLELTALNEQVVRLYEAGRTDDALALAKTALEVAEQRFGRDNPAITAALVNLAGLLRALGRGAEAVPLLERDLAIAEKMLGPAHPEVAPALEILAELYCRSGRFADAEAFRVRALAIAETAFGPDHPALGTALSNLADLYRIQGRYREALPLYQRDLAIGEKALGRDHPDFATTLNNLAAVHEAQGRYREAEPLYTEALRIRERTLGAEHPDLATALDNLAGLYQSQGRYADAEALYRRALTILERALGRDHPDVGTALNNLAGLYEAQGRLAEAEALYGRSLAVREASLGPDHPDVGVTLHNLAGLYKAQGRGGDAEPLYRRSLAVLEAAFGRDHPSVATTLNNLAGLYRSGGRHAEAGALYERCLDIVEASYDSGHPHVAATLNNMAVNIASQGRLAEAAPLFERALAIREEALGPDHPDVGLTLNNLAELNAALGRMAEAAALAERARRIPGWRTAHIPVLFSTNRRRVSDGGAPAFGDAQMIDAADVSAGVCTVLAPESEVTNRAERGAAALGQLHNALGRQSYEFSLSVEEIELIATGRDLARRARERLARAVRFPGQAIVYVHGYNNTFEAAVRRTAKIAFDLDFDGVAVAFAWPSKRGFLGYGADRERARIAAPFLLDMLETMGRELPEVTVHLIGHSTGGEVLMHTLERLADRGTDSRRVNLGELILAHADVNRLRFRQALPALKKLGLGVTSYSSGEDWAMWLSRVLRFEKARLGGRPIHADGVDSIDLTGLGSGALGLNHNVFVTNPIAFGDMAQLMRTRVRPPDRRTPVFERVRTANGAHWAYKRD